MAVSETGRPLYIQVKENLAKLIISGEWPPGIRLASERELTDQLGVSRVTVRNAIQALEEDGLVYRVHGKGTFVAKPKMEMNAHDLISFTSSMLRRGNQPSAQVLEFSRISAGRNVAKALKVELGHQVYRVRRLRQANNLPLVIELSFFPRDLCSRLEEVDLAAVSIYHVLYEEMGIQCRKVHQSLEAVAATEEEAQILEVETGFPLMLVERLCYNTDGRVIEFAKDLYRGDCSRFISDLEP